MKHKRTRDIVIELTSLLDVVMILIFYVMIQNSQLVSELQEKNAAMEAKLEGYAGIDEELGNALGKLEEGDLETLLEQLHDAENQLEAYEYMDDIIVVFNIGLENRYNNTSRCLTYGRASDKDYKPYTVERTATDAWNEAISHLKLDLNTYVAQELQENAEDKYIYLVFSYDDSKVYDSDWADVKKVLTDCETKYGSDRVRYIPNSLKGE